MDRVLESRSVEETIGIGKKLAGLLRPDDVVILTGDLGAGKTHLTKGIALGLGIEDEITSPTFNILRMHDGRTADETPIELAHWDIYRLEDPSQLDDVDYFGILESGCISIVEWGDKFPDDMPDDYMKVDISLDAEGVRRLAFEGHGLRGDELAARMGSVSTEEDGYGKADNCI